ncbi:MAG: radical SAM protein, partial [Dehalococcoidia bacterium]|nr:radical SAM protein [Dehalococcoidia bacterium]
INPFQSLQELRVIVANLDVTSCFFSSMHASNYLTIRGTLPEDRDRMLSQIDKVLERRDPSLLRPEGFRGL